MSSQIVRFPAPGCVVEFMHGGRAVQAWVLGEQSGTLRLYTVNKREMKLPAARILPWSGPMYATGASRADMDERLERARVKRDEISAELDLLQLWELAQGEVAQADITWFAELLWPLPSVDHIAALGQAMIAQKMYFRFNPPFFEIFTAQEVADRAAKQEHVDRLSELTSVGGEFFRRLLEAERVGTVLAEADYPAPTVASDLQSLLMTRIADPDAHDPDNVWKIIAKGFSAKNMADDSFLPLRLAIVWGIVPPHYNFYLDRAVYEDGDDWADAAVVGRLSSAVAAGLPDLPELARGRVFVSVDPDETQDFDDAAWAEERPDGYRVALALACPAWLWPFGDAFDKQVMRRSSSLYLPEGNHFMLPRQLCIDSYSLVAGTERPTMLLEINLDKDLQVLSVNPAVGRLTVVANITLAESEAALEGGAGAEGAGAAAPHAAMLALLQRLALALRQKRLKAGAVITERVDTDITLNREGGETVVEIHPAKYFEKSQLMVGEMMILANSVMGSWAVEHGVSLLYRTQIASLPKESTGVWTAPHDIHRVLRDMPPARLSVQAGVHAGVGVAAYTSLTAPMRRYPDLLNQAQIMSWLRGSRQDKGALEVLLPVISARQDAVSQVQRFRTRYWKLVFLQQAEQRKKGLNYWEAVITDENNVFVTVTLRLTGLVLRGPRQLFGERVSPGADVGVRVGKINPMRNEIQIMEVVEY